MACDRQHAAACILAAGPTAIDHASLVGPSIGAGRACLSRTGARPGAGHARRTGTRSRALVAADHRRPGGTGSRATTAYGSAQPQPGSGRRLATARPRDGLAGRSGGEAATAPHARPPATRWPGTGPRGHCRRLAGAGPRRASRRRPDSAASDIRAADIRAGRHTRGCAGGLAAVAKPCPEVPTHAGNRTGAAARGIGPAGCGDTRNRPEPGTTLTAAPGGNSRGYTGGNDRGYTGAGHVRSAVARGCAGPAIRRPPATGAAPRAKPVHDRLRARGARRGNPACPGAVGRGSRRRNPACRDTRFRQDNRRGTHAHADHSASRPSGAAARGGAAGRRFRSVAAGPAPGPRSPAGRRGRAARFRAGGTSRPADAGGRGPWRRSDPPCHPPPALFGPALVHTALVHTGAVHAALIHTGMAHDGSNRRRDGPLC